MKVAVNPPKTPVTKGSSGVAAATVPNVCKMPGPPAPFVPTPLPNIGKSGDSPKDYTKKVKVENKTVAVKGASFGSTGDAASKGTGGGLISANTHGPTKFAGPGSMDVKFEGKNVQLLSDPMLNNCGSSGSPPNSATLLGVIQGALMTVVEGGKECPVCGATDHKDLCESEATLNEAEALESSLQGAGFGPDDINMLCVAYCQCGSKKAAARSSMERSGDFRDVAKGYLTPAYPKHAKAKAVLRLMKGHISNKGGFDAAVDKAKDLRADFESLNSSNRGKIPQVNPPGSCAAPRALVLILEDGGLPGALTERWCGGPEMSNPVTHLRIEDGERVLVEDRIFKAGESVPPCGSCDILLPFLICDAGKQCH